MHPIIKEYLDKGYIDKEASIRLEKFEDLIKEAGFFDVIKAKLPGIWKSMKESAGIVAKTSIGPMAGAVTGMAMVDYLNKSKAKKDNVAQSLQLAKSFQNMQHHAPELTKHDEGVVRERFEEIANISPTLAGSPGVASKMVLRTLKEGLNESDVQKLYQIESSASKISNRGSMHRMAPVVEGLGNALGRTAVEQGMRAFDMEPTQVPQAGNAPVANVKSPQDNRDFQSMVAEGKERVAKTGLNIDHITPDMSIDRIRAAKRSGVKLSFGLDDVDVNTDKGVYEAREIMSKNPNSLFTVWPEYDVPIPTQAPAKKGFFSIFKKANAIADAHILVKEAGLPDGFLRGILTAAAFGTATGVANLAASEISSRRRKADLADSWETTQANIKRMAKDGHSNMLGIDYSDNKTRESAKNTFNTLVAVAPDLASNSTIATDYVTKILRAGELDVNAIKTVSEIQKNMDNISGYKSPFSGSPIVKGFETGFQTAGGKDMIGALAKDVNKSDKLKKYESAKLDSDISNLNKAKG